MRGVEQLMVKFNDRMVIDVVQTFWATMQRGEFITDAAAQGRVWAKHGCAHDADCKADQASAARGTCRRITDR